VVEYISSQFSYCWCRYFLQDTKDNVTLVPLQKFSLNCQIVDMNCSEPAAGYGAAWTNGIVIDSDGILYDWTPMTGLQKTSASSIYTDSHKAGVNAFSPRYGACKLRY
jgi:hypothetical protein